MGLGVALFELLMGTERNGTGRAGLANVCGAGLGWTARYLSLILLDMEPGGGSYLTLHWADNGNLWGWGMGN